MSSTPAATSAVHSTWLIALVSVACYAGPMAQAETPGRGRISEGNQAPIRPKIVSISPASAIAGGADFDLTISGSSFPAVNGKVWYIGDANGKHALMLKSVNYGGTQFVVTIPAARTANPGKAAITVQLPPSPTPNAALYSNTKILFIRISSFSLAVTGTERANGMVTFTVTVSTTGNLTGVVVIDGATLTPQGQAKPTAWAPTPMGGFPNLGNINAGATSAAVDIDFKAGDVGAAGAAYTLTVALEVNQAAQPNVKEYPKPQAAVTLP